MTATSYWPPAGSSMAVTGQSLYRPPTRPHRFVRVRVRVRVWKTVASRCLGPIVDFSNC